MAADLAHDTAARADPSTPGRYRIDLPAHWSYILPSGGVAMTAALRAAETHLAEPPLRLASATTIFTTPIEAGELVADVHVIRRGRSATQVRVALCHAKAEANDDSGHGADRDVHARAPRSRRDRERAAGVGREAGRCAPVEDAQSNNPHVRFPFFHQLDCKLAPAKRSGARASPPGRPSSRAGFATGRRSAMARAGSIGSALPPIIDTMPTALHRAVGPGEFRFFAPSLDLTVYTVDDTRREWLLVATTLKRARAGWAVADAEVWDDEGRFVAYGTQAMYLQTLSGEPPVVDASGR